MSDFLREFEFKKQPIEITYLENEPLKLNQNFAFFHNKSKFRKDLTRLQYLFKSYTNIALNAFGIRDSYLNNEYFDKYLIVLFTTNEIIKDANQIIKNHSEIQINSGCFYIFSNSRYVLLLARDIEGLVFGIDTIENILKQIMEDYLNKKNFDDYITIRSFKLLNCSKSS
ncbi:MAG: hypothetical protein ACFE8L_11890 [Candidatus Hodarchaeota archaeon]